MHSTMVVSSIQIIHFVSVFMNIVQFHSVFDTVDLAIGRYPFHNNPAMIPIFLFLGPGLMWTSECLNRS